MINNNIQNQKDVDNIELSEEQLDIIKKASHEEYKSIQPEVKIAGKSTIFLILIVILALLTVNTIIKTNNINNSDETQKIINIELNEEDLLH